MKKIITILLALLLILCMAVPAAAVTPPLNTPASPTVPDIEVEIEIPDEVFDDWFEEHPITITPTEEPTEPPTEPPAEIEPCIPGWYNWLDWFHKWFPWIPDRECPDATQPTEPTEPTKPEVILAAPVITEASYYHQGTMSRLQMQWEDVEGAEYYEVLITRADGETITYNPTDNMIFDKAAECPRVYIEAERLWASASVQVRAVAGDVYSEWSEAEKIGCDMLHNF